MSALEVRSELPYACPNCEGRMTLECRMRPEITQELLDKMTNADGSSKAEVALEHSASALERCESCGYMEARK